MDVWRCRQRVARVRRLLKRPFWRHFARITQLLECLKEDESDTAGTGLVHGTAGNKGCTRVVYVTANSCAATFLPQTGGSEWGCEP